MRILLLDLLEEPEAHRSYDAVPDISVWRREDADLPVVWPAPARITAENVGEKKLRLTVSARPVLKAVCDRCLKETDVEVPLEESEEIDFSKSEQERLADLDETVYVHGAELDVEEWISTLLHIHMPMKILCREDCRGICPVCGADLNQGPCGCGEGPVDPRMAAALDVFMAAQEQPQDK